MTAKQRQRRRAILQGTLFVVITLVGPALAGMITG